MPEPAHSAFSCPLFGTDSGRTRAGSLTHTRQLPEPSVRHWEGFLSDEVRDECPAGTRPNSFVQDGLIGRPRAGAPSGPAATMAHLPVQSRDSHPVRMLLLPAPSGGHKRAPKGNLGTSESVHDCFTASRLFTWHRQVMCPFLLGPIVL